MDVFKCVLCDNIVEVLRNGKGDLVCCGKIMEKIRENTRPYVNEKFTPVLKKTDSGLLVTVGNLDNPGNKEHFVEWIQVDTEDGKSFRKFISKGEKPCAEFPVKDENIVAGQYCNLNGLWKVEV
ncbi:MAG: hypothetical protein CSB21_02155 [Deltaproteobacteria bacterium]|nr:MAG: hypothetical protein CSB21_02155 [Deltaproteobacteria bacterium]